METSIRKRILSMWLKHTFYLLIGLFISSAVKAQDGAIVSYKLEYPKQIHTGDSIKVIVTLDVKEGFYIYAPMETNSSQGMQVTQLRFVPQQLPADLEKAGSLQFPKPHSKGAYQVFTGEGIKLIQTFIASKDMQPGDITLKGKLISQACNDHMCYPPVAEPFEAVIRVINK